MKGKGGAEKLKTRVLACVPSITDQPWTITEGYNLAVAIQKSPLYAFAGPTAQAEVNVSMQWLMNMKNGEAPQKGHCMSAFLDE
eukprot:6490702-Amphidinium_carterae.1